MIQSARVTQSLFVGGFCLSLLTQCVGTAPPEAPSAEQPEATDPLGDRVGTGTARVTGTIRSADLEEPLPLGGVLLALGDAVSHSNVDGSFVLLGVPGGRQTFFVDAAGVLARDGHYGQFLGELEIGDGQDRHIERPIYLPFIPRALEQSVTPTAATRIVSGEGIVLDVPAGAARMIGREYDGPIALLSVPPELAPLAWPSRFDGRIDATITIQPVGLEFPVPVSISFPAAEGETPEGETWLLWSLIGDAAGADNVAVSAREVDRIVPVSGGVLAGGWHALTGMEYGLREPCRGGDLGEAKACLTAAVELLDAVRNAATVRSAGIDAVLAELAGMFSERTNSAEQLQSTIRASEDLFRIASGATDDYQRVYGQLTDLRMIHAGLDTVLAACAPVEGCAATSLERQALEGEFAEQLDLLEENIGAFSSLFDRLAASMSLLDPFYTVGRSLTDDHRGPFSNATEEFIGAYEAFDPIGLPIDAHDGLMAVLGDAERTAGALVDAVSADPEADDGSGATLVRVCENRGTTQHVAAVDGIAPLVRRRETGAPNDECLIVAMNAARGLTSIPVAEDRLAAALHPPVLLPLVAGIAAQVVQLDQPAAGRLTRDMPVHQWSFPSAERTGLHVRFVAEGDALAGFASGDGLTQIARRGGFDVFNMPAGGGSSLLAFGDSLVEDGEVTYRFSVDENQNLFDFGSPVTGTFDVETRGSAILFDAQLGQRVLIERTCCDPLGTLFSHLLIGPDGAEVRRIDSLVDDNGVGSELFELSMGGRHRVLITPFDEQFADYELSVRLISLSPPVEYALGSVAGAAFQGPGETISFVFVAAGETVLTVEGLSSTGPDPVRLSLIGPEGVVVAEDQSLFLDGSSFSVLSLALPDDGPYTLSFRAPLNSDPATGAFSFRATVGEL